MVEGIRKCIIELKNLEQGLEYAVADINKRNLDLTSKESLYTIALKENETLKKENESLKAEIAELKNKLETNENISTRE